MKTILRLLCAAVLGVGLGGTVSAVDTAGTVTLTAQLSNAGGNYAPKHVVAVWVTNQALGYIKCLWKDGSGWTSEGTTHLDKLKAARGSSTVLDGYSGATISTYNLFTVTWNCSNANNTALAPDGTYYFHIETTDKNSAGPYSGSLPMLKSTNAFTTNYPAQTYIKNMVLTFTPAVLTHDVAVTGLTPTTALPNTNVTVVVTVTNKTTSTEAFSLMLSNTTSAVLIGTKAIGSLAGRAVTNVSFVWNTTNLSGTYNLRATAGPLTGETSTNDNTLTVPVLVQAIPHDLAVTGITPNVVEPNSIGTLYVGVTNKTTVTESFSVTLSNLSTATLIGTQTITSLAGNRGTNVAFTWNTASLLGDQILKATAGPVAGEGYTADNSITNIVTVRPYIHDVGIPSFTASTLVFPNSTANLTVVVTNAGEAAETFSVQLSDDTAARPILPAILVSNLASFSATNLALIWTATNATFGTHTLRAVAGPVPGETALVNNTNTARVIVATGWTSSTLIARRSAWRFNDQGLDLTSAPWQLPDYPDSEWGTGTAPLGYSQDGQMPDLTTILSWGLDATNKYPTSYLRRDFYVDFLPLALTVKVRRVDGVVLYLNSVELTRHNMPTGLVSYATSASSAVVDALRTNYYSIAVSLTNMVTGKNTLAAEIHRATPDGKDLAFDLEMTGTVPQIPDTHLVDATALSSAVGGIVGDQVPVAVTVTNRGNRTETVQVFLKDNVTGQIVGFQVITGLGPAGTATAQFDWATLGAGAGANSLSAYTVVGGVTNFAGVVTNTVMLEGTGFVTTPANVTGSIGGRCAAVAATGNLLLVGAGATLEVWNRANPAVPVKVGQVRLPGLIEGIATKDTFAFIACGNVGVHFVDLSVPTAPTYLSTYNTSGHASGLAVSGNYLYVADGIAGLRIVNISTPAAPTLAGAYYTAGPARAVSVVGTTAYLLNVQTGLLILDVGSPAAPTLLGSCTSIDAGQDLAVAGGYAYVVDANNHFYAVNVANPASPTLANVANTFVLPNLVAQSLVLNGATAYVAAGAGGLAILNVATPATPVLVGAVATPGQAVAASLAGTTLYLADGFHGLQVYDVSAATTPVLQADLPTAIRARDVVVNNNLALVAAGEAGLRIYNLSTAQPTLVGTFAGALNARCVAVSGTTAYVGDGQYGLKIVSMASPAAPALLGSWSGTNLSNIRNIGVSGSLVAASDGRQVCLFDVSVSASPTLVTTYATPAFAFDMTVSGGRAYLACGNAGLVILDPGAGTLTPRSVTATMGLASGIAVSGNTAYVANGASGWLIYDVSNPTAPVLVKADVAQGPVSSVAVSGVMATLANGANAAITMDVTRPLTPVTSQVFNGLANAWRVAAVGGQAYVSEDEAGLAILNGPLVLQILPAAGSATDLSLKWISKPGKTYAIYRSGNLSLGRPGFSLVQANIPATPPLNSVSFAAVGGEPSFFIISEQ